MALLGSRTVTKWSTLIRNRIIWISLVLLIVVGVEWNLLNSSKDLSQIARRINEKSFQSEAHSIQRGYELAYNHSLGYFLNSISDNEWKMRQKWAQEASYHRYNFNPERHWNRPELWYFNNYDPTFTCPFQKRVRGVGDGPKWTCDPHQLKRIAKEESCLIYSIGSNGDYQWEDGMYIETDGLCEVHVFNYSRDYSRDGDPARNIHFHRWGLQSSLKAKRGPAWRTLPEMIWELGHENRTINVFKIDCEGCEWESFRDWIGLDIRQILIETHRLPENRTLGLEFFDSFTDNNYLMFSKEVNPWGGGNCLEFSYIKLHPEFLGDRSIVNDTLYTVA